MSARAAQPPGPTAAPASEAGDRGRSCCLRSCLGCLVLLLLLGAALVFAWLRFGSPWLETQKERLTERFPIAGRLLAPDTVLPFRGLSLRGGEIGGTGRETFPADVWLPDEALEGVFNTTGETALAVLTLEPVEPAQLAARARSEMAARGWRRTPVPDPHDGIALRFERQERVAWMKIYASGMGTELWVRCGRREAPPAGRRSGTG